MGALEMCYTDEELSFNVPEITEAYKAMTRAVTNHEWLLAWDNWCAEVNKRDGRLVHHYIDIGWNTRPAVILAR